MPKVTSDLDLGEAVHLNILVEYFVFGDIMFLLKEKQKRSNSRRDNYPGIIN